MEPAPCAFLPPAAALWTEPANQDEELKQMLIREIRLIAAGRKAWVCEDLMFCKTVFSM
jgi:hypothetical protein